jgi:hypothetical protein
MSDYSIRIISKSSEVVPGTSTPRRIQVAIVCPVEVSGRSFKQTRMMSFTRHLVFYGWTGEYIGWSLPQRGKKPELVAFNIGAEAWRDAA